MGFSGLGVAIGRSLLQKRGQGSAVGMGSLEAVELSECTLHLVEYAANRGLARIPRMPRIKGSVLRCLPFFVLMGVGKTMLHIPLRWSGRSTLKPCYRHTAPLERKTCCGLRRITAVKNWGNTPAKTPLLHSYQLSVTPLPPSQGGKRKSVVSFRQQSAVSGQPSASVGNRSCVLQSHKEVAIGRSLLQKIERGRESEFPPTEEGLVFIK